MTQWDYLVLQCQPTGDGVWRTRFMNGVEQPNWTRNLDMYAYMRQLGDAGWELVHVHIDTIAQASWVGTTKAQETACRLFFKRGK